MANGDSTYRGDREEGADRHDNNGEAFPNAKKGNDFDAKAGGAEDGDDVSATKMGKEFNGPCVVYLSPDDESRIRLEALRDLLRGELFPEYDAFSPSSSVSPFPEKLPRKASQFRPLLPIARFPSVDAAVRVARMLQQTWDPLSFNMTDLQFLSRDDEPDNDMAILDDGLDDIPVVRHRRKCNGLFSSPSSSSSYSLASSAATQRMALTTSGEVEDVSRRGAYGCDAMVMLWGEEPEEELMDEEASLSMIVDDDDDGNREFEVDDCEEDAVATSASLMTGRPPGPDRKRINYDEVFATAEREYQRMRAHEELSPSSYVGEVPIFDDTSSRAVDIEALLDDDDAADDEGATVVIGRAQFFMGAMREFVGMPASSAIDSKDRIMGGGVSAVARRKGSVSRLAESWDVGDYGEKEADRRVK